MKLPGYGVFAAMLAAAGLPIYLHAPAFYAAEYGIGLSALAAVLFALRMIDVVQDPMLGWLSARLSRHRTLAVAIAIIALAASMAALFAVTPPIAPLAWFAGALLALFSSYSFLTITFYAQGVAKAATLGPIGHLRVAAWREPGALIGISAAAIAPAVLVGGYAWFATGFCLLCAAAWFAMRGQWQGTRQPDTGLRDFRRILGDRICRRLLLIALANAAPVAVSSSLFLFFVQDVLADPNWAGPLLLVFFLSAAIAAPVWARIAGRIGTRNSLSLAILLSVAVFAPVPLLGPGDTGIFALVCLASGIAIGADVTLLPAMFARRMEQIAPSGTAGFGLWSFVTKLSLALAAVLLLPALDAAGFRAGGDSAESALRLLALMYAGLPCVLKLVALALLWAGPLEHHQMREA